MPLTGHTLAASLKICCELTGAQYAIYWVNTHGSYVVASDFASQDGLKSFTQASSAIALTADGSGPVATVATTGAPVFVANAGSEESLERREAATASGVKSICMIPFQAGVLEFGCTDGWTEMPAIPKLPTKEMREAFEDFGAKYVMLWSETGGNFSVVADFKIPERVAALKNKRGDDLSYITESRALKLPASGDAYVAAAARGGEAIFCQQAASDEKLERRELAKEFCVDGINFVPVEGGVLECGIPTEAKLNGNTLYAALKMRCDTSGSGYSCYWTQEDGEYVIAGTYVTPECEAQGKGNFPEASQGIRLPASGTNPVATVASTLKPVFVSDAAAEETMNRGSLAAECGIESICMKPTEGGVIEFGTLKGGSKSWSEMPDVPDLPKAEMKKAFDEIGAVYMCFWQKQGETYFITGGYELPERCRALKSYRGDDETFASKSQSLVYATGGDGFIATAADAGKEIVIADATADAVFNRAELAKEFGIGTIHIVPCKDGVLEYGNALFW